MPHATLTGNSNELLGLIRSCTAEDQAQALERMAARARSGVKFTISDKSTEAS